MDANQLRMRLVGATVLVDVDEVLADFITPYVALLNRELGTDFRAAAVDQWDITTSLGVPEHRDTIDRLCREPGFCASLEPCVGAKEGMRKLRSVADVHIVTSPMGGKHWHAEREEWLAYHFGFDPEDITFTHQKRRVRGDYLIDDRTSTLNAWKQAHPDGVAIQWWRPSNAADVFPLPHWKLNDWDTLVGLIQHTESKRGNQP